MRQNSFDVLVVGGGVIGASIAWRLAQAGVSIALIERTSVGAEASTAGAGMLAPGGELSEDTAFARLMVESARMYAGFIDELQSASHTAVEYRRCGAVQYGPIERRRVRVQGKLGIRVEDRPSCGFDTPQGLFSRAPEPCLYYPDDAYVDPVALMNALRNACARAGVVELRGDVKAIGVAHHIKIGPWVAAAAVVAAGAWSGSIEVEGVPALPRSKPMRGHLVSYQAAPGLLDCIHRAGHTYLFQRVSGTVIAGATTEDVGFDRHLDPTCVADIDFRAKQLVPALRGIGVKRAWLGFRPAMVEGHPAIGRYYETPLWLAYGHYRNGILGAPATAASLSRELLSILGKR